MHPDPENQRAANNKKYYIQMIAEQEVDTKGDQGDAVQVILCIIMFWYQGSVLQGCALFRTLVLNGKNDVSI